MNGESRVAIRYALFSAAAAVMGAGFVVGAPRETIVLPAIRTVAGMIAPPSEPTSIVMGSIAMLAFTTMLRRRKNQQAPDDSRRDPQ